MWNGNYVNMRCVCLYKSVKSTSNKHPFFTFGPVFFINNIWLLLWVTFLYFFQLKIYSMYRKFAKTGDIDQFSKRTRHSKMRFLRLFHIENVVLYVCYVFIKRKFGKTHFLLYCAFCKLNNVSSFWGFPVYVSPVTCNSSEWMRKI